MFFLAVGYQIFPVDFQMYEYFNFTWSYKILVHEYISVSQSFLLTSATNTTLLLSLLLFLLPELGVHHIRRVLADESIARKSGLLDRSRKGDYVVDGK